LAQAISASTAAFVECCGPTTSVSEIEFHPLVLPTMSSVPHAMLLLVSTMLLRVRADAFLHAGGGMDVVSLSVRSEELQAALGSVLGCGPRGPPSAGEVRHTAAIREELLPIWRTLPKANPKADRVEWRLVRYLAHRHFMHRFGIVVRGLEPSIQVNSSFAGEATILSQDSPALAEQLAGSRGKHGFSLDDAAVMVAALEQLLFDSDRILLEMLYKKKSYPTNKPLNMKQMQKLMEDYMVYWMLGNDKTTADMMIVAPSLLEEHIPHWKAVADMAAGTVRTLAYTRLRLARPGVGRAAFEDKYSFEDALEVAGNIGRNFAFFWDNQCQDIKSSLLAMDSTGAGRVRLPDFYGANKEGEWRFGESEAYLRELGALDETSSWRGKQVIVSNYIQAVSNCVVARPHYLVCCINECEEMMGYVEAAVGSPVATVEELLTAVQNLTNGDDVSANLDESLRSQLHRIASMHGGRVPLHGRLFGQWLHFAFPRECPFPHQTRAEASRTPHEFGDDFAVSEIEVNAHLAEEAIKKVKKGPHNASGAEWQMSQWSEEEELLGDYTVQLGGPVYRQRLVIAGSGASVAFLGLLCFLAKSKRGHDATTRPLKTHHV